MTRSRIVQKLHQFDGSDLAFFTDEVAWGVVADLEDDGFHSVFVEEMVAADSGWEKTRAGLDPGFVVGNSGTDIFKPAGDEAGCIAFVDRTHWVIDVVPGGMKVDAEVKLAAGLGLSSV